MATYGKDVPVDRPNPGGRAAIFVPSSMADAELIEKLRPGSGMVGFGNKDGSVTVYFEGNKFNDSSLYRWEDKIAKAYDRMVKLAPTVNKVTLDMDNLEQVGFTEASGLTVRKMDLLRGWLSRTNMLDSGPAEEFISYNTR